MVSVKFDPIDRSTVLFLTEEMSPEAQSRALASFARENIRDAERINRAALGYVPEFEQFVDGSRGRSIDQVKPDGTVVVEFDLMSELLSWIDLQLVTNSPRKTGAYQRSHILLADGVEVEPGQQVDAGEYVFLNTQPYARRIEKGLSKQARKGVYQVIAALARRRFGNVARISFSYRALAGTKASARQPAIIVNV